ncbi:MULTISPECIES: ABC transporter ATP-binding protein [Acetobacterium]|uniref:Putative ABC transporter ATP-binding protein n=1 Tax=Acetobacterium wieringae TaxID=52694 RepID=A0A1F2PI16_9FIRM|nr:MULTISPECIES: ABC transporter ATP-binding protein [Acetobacterium]OFV70973.1 putative ABC transporter ATP-binding protein [Acetobacterium wieringae]OXS26800.1 MAG: ABC transporter [Acetobacterium sp. MES1]
MSIEVANLSFSYGTHPILKHVSFAAQENQLLSILGANGVGKSTLFRCMLGLQKGYSGQILLHGKNLNAMSIMDIAKAVAYIPQSHYPSFNYSVFDMVLMGTTHQVSVISKPGKKQLQLVEQALERLGISHLKKRGYTQISGGERQLVLMARALVQKAKILILDEPTANLDYGNQIRVLTQIKSLAQEGYTIIQSTHNPDQTFLFSDTVMAMKDGEIAAWGQPGDIFTEELIRNLYAAEVTINSLYDDRVRVCVPKCAI